MPKGEYIVQKGDTGEEMFFINKRIVEVVSQHENPMIFDTMEPVQFFGEISTIFSCPRTASNRTKQTLMSLYWKRNIWMLCSVITPDTQASYWDRWRTTKTAERKDRSGCEKERKKQELERQKFKFPVVEMKWRWFGEPRGFRISWYIPWC